MPETQRREVPRLVGDELTTAVSFLDFQREAILRTCEGLADDQLRWVGVPTGTNLLGLVSHLVDSEFGGSTTTSTATRGTATSTCRCRRR
jgi:hypothetical protein